MGESSKWKKLAKTSLSVLLAGSLMFGVGTTMSAVGASTKAPAKPTATKTVQQFKPGTYTGVGTGKNGEVKVEVTFTASTIDSIVVVGGNGETKGIGSEAL